MENEIDLASKHFHRTLEHHLKIFDIGSIGRDHLCIKLLAKLGYLTHTHSNRCVAKSNDRTLLNGLLSHFPGDTLVVKRAEYHTTLTFQKIITHIF